MDVVYSQRALDDLDRLVEFVQHLPPAQADATAALIVQAVEILACHPLIGRPAGPRLRELVISRGRSGYIALYHVDYKLQEVQVLALRHQREAGYEEFGI